MKTRRITCAISIVLLFIFWLPVSTFAQSGADSEFTWIGNISNEWTTSGNWSVSASITQRPPEVNEIAIFNSAGSNQSIQIGTAGGAAGTLKFNGGAYTIGQSAVPSTIRLSGRESLVEVASGVGAQTINAQLVVLESGARTITNSSSSNLNLAGGVHFQSGGTHTLSIGGTGGVQLSSLSSVSSSTLTVQRVGSTSGSVVVNGAVSGNVTVATGITVNGNVSASGGNLVVNGTVDSLSVQSGGILSGTGTVNTATIGNGGQHRPGTSPGLQSFTTLTYNNGSTFVWELSGSGSVRGFDFDAVNANTVNILSGASSELSISTILLNDTTFWNQDRNWQVFSAPNINGSFTITGAAVSALSSKGNFRWDGGTLRFSAVPEPGTLALLGLVSTVGFGVTRFRKRKNKAAA